MARRYAAIGQRHVRAARSNLNVRRDLSGASPDGSTSMCSKPCNSVSIRIRKRCGCAARPPSILSARSKSDGCDTLPNEDAAVRSRRDGPTRAGLQSHLRHEHHGDPTAHGGNAGIVKSKNSRRSPTHRVDLSLYFMPFDPKETSMGTKAAAELFHLITSEAGASGAAARYRRYRNLDRRASCPARRERLAAL